MTVTLHETATGAQILPRPKLVDDRRTVTEWLAHLVCDADQRGKSPELVTVAGRLEVRVVA